MTISIFELFSIGIGPSSSHTVGPMRAANAFVDSLKAGSLLTKTEHIQVDLYGSLALTGKGHGTDPAIINGLEGKSPETVVPDTILSRVEAIKQSKQLSIGGEHAISFDVEKDLLFHQQETLPKHSNGVRFTAKAKDTVLLQQVYYSIGGGFIVTEENFDKPITSKKSIPYAFDSAKELLQLCNDNNLSISELMMENEKAWRSEQETKDKILEIVAVMKQSIEHGCETTGTLPGVLNVNRRAPRLFEKLNNTPADEQPSQTMNWLNLYALAVNEENAAGGRIVTAPTNGAAGVIPAVLHYYIRFNPNANEDGIINFMLTAGAIAILYKKGASISAAEVGCQGEIGVACSMAAGALAAVLGGTCEQVENAAEIGMEHNLGLTCDPIQGLVQIPCIERNAMGANQAVNAAILAMMEEGKNKVDLDSVIATMLQTGRDMQTKYKETSLGGLAVNHPEC